AVVGQCRTSPVAPGPSAMPTKLSDGFTPFWKVSNAIAIPWMPEKPSPPPAAPSAVGAVLLASASVSVSPSAPLPPSIDRSNEASSATDGIALGQNADPTALGVAGVSTRLPSTSAAEPLSVQPPASGPGISALSTVLGTFWRGWLALCHERATFPVARLLKYS